MALIEKTGAIDVYFEDTIEIVLLPDDPDPTAAVADVLATKDVQYTSVTRRAGG